MTDCLDIYKLVLGRTGRKVQSVPDSHFLIACRNGSRKIIRFLLNAFGCDRLGLVKEGLRVAKWYEKGVAVERLTRHLKKHGIEEFEG